MEYFTQAELDLCAEIEAGNNEEAKRIANELKLDDLNKPNQRDRETLLHIAVRCQNGEMIIFLIKKEVDLEGRSTEGLTAFSLACTCGHIETMGAFFKNTSKPDINAEDKWGKTPLDSAISFQDKKVVSFLVKKGAKATQEQLIKMENKIKESKEIYETLIKGV